MTDKKESLQVCKKNNAVFKRIFTFSASNFLTELHRFFPNLFNKKIKIGNEVKNAFISNSMT